MALSPHVRRGQTLRIPHTDYNAFLDAAERSRRSRSGQGGGAPADVYQQTVVLVRNTDGATYDQFSALGLESPSIAIAANPRHVLEYPIFNASLPTALSEGRFCVIQEPARSGQIVRAVISGGTWVRLVKTTAYDEFCDVSSGVPWLVDSPAGSAQILYDQGAIQGTQFAFVRLWGKQYGKAFVGKVKTGGITARSGTTPGSGAVDLYRDVSGTLTDTGRDVDVLSWRGAAVAVGEYVDVYQDFYGDWWTIPAAVGTLDRIWVSLNATLATTDATVSCNVESVRNGTRVAVNDTITANNFPLATNYLFSGASGARFQAIWSDVHEAWDLDGGQCPAQ